MLSRIHNLHPAYLFVICLSIVPVVDTLNFQLGTPLPGSALTATTILSYLAMTYAAVRMIGDFETENGYFRMFALVFLAYQTILLIRCLPLGFTEFKMYFQYTHIIWPSLIPFLIFCRKDDKTLTALLRSIFGLGITFILISCAYSPVILSRVTAETFIQPLAFSSSFLFLNARYLKPAKRWVPFIALTIALIALMLLARRNGVASYGGVICLSLLLLVKNTSLKTSIKLLPFLALGICLAVVFSDTLSEKLAGKLKERLNEDTRTDIFDSFFKAMEGDMVFGRGADGKYYSPVDEMVTEDGMKFDEIEYRDVIENGYLQLILKGGIVNMALFLMLLLPASVLGIFFSNNDFTRACGIIILLWCIDMLIYGLPRLTLQYILVWISVGICYKKSLRKKDHAAWQELFTQSGLG